MEQQSVDEYLGSLSDDVEEIGLQHFELTVLPDLTRFQKLELLCCDNNFLTTLPDNLPQSLKWLFCYNNNLTKLPNNLPPKLIQLVCCNNNLSVIAENLPQCLRVLNYNNNNLSTIPDNLPQSLELFEYYNNPLLQQKYPKLIYNIFTEKTRNYIYQVNMQHKAIDRMAILNANGVLLEHSAKIIGNPNLHFSV